MFYRWSVQQLEIKQSRYIYYSDTTLLFRRYGFFDYHRICPWMTCRILYPRRRSWSAVAVDRRSRGAADSGGSYASTATLTARREGRRWRPSRARTVGGRRTTGRWRRRRRRRRRRLDAAGSRRQRRRRSPVIVSLHRWRCLQLLLLSVPRKYINRQSLLVV